jgi:hypothetical protein
VDSLRHRRRGDGLFGVATVNKLYTALIFALFLSTQASALPDTPKPKHAVALTREHSELYRTVAQSGAVVFDIVTTNHSIARGYVEKDPIARFVIGSRPSYAQMIPLGVAEVVGSYLLVKKYPKLHWLQISLTVTHTTCGAHNLTLK